jgi:hypothetical protein
MSSKRCPKCGFVSFAAAGTCKRCGAALSASPTVAPPPLPRQQTTRKKGSPLLVYIIGGVISLILGVFVFGVTADYGILPLGLFAAVFIGGMIVSLIIANRLKGSSNEESQQSSSTGKNYLSVVVYMLASFVLLLPLFVIRLNSDLPSDVMAEKTGELTGACLVPAIIMALWMRFSKQEEWSWLAVGLRYLLLFFIFAFSVVFRMLVLEK